MILGLLFAVGFLAQALHLKLPEVKVPEGPPKAGFYRGFTGEGALFFVTYQHPQWGEVPLREYGLLRSNSFKLYAFSFSTVDLKLEVATFKLRNITVTEGNVTRVIEEPYDERVTEVPVHIIGGSFTETEVELPVSTGG